MPRELRPVVELPALPSRWRSSPPASSCCTTSNAKEAHTGPDDVDLPAGTAFDPTSVYEIARESLPRVVILAGEQRSGKTTLIASLYELFQEGPVGRFDLAPIRGQSRYAAFSVL